MNEQRITTPFSRRTRVLGGVLLIACSLAASTAVDARSAQQPPPPPSAASELTAATRLYERADYAVAALRLEQALATGLPAPDRIRAREMLAVCYFALAQIAKATEAIRALLKDDPSREPAPTLPIDFRELFGEIKRDVAKHAALEADLDKLRAGALRGESRGIAWVDIPGGSFDMGCSSVVRMCGDTLPRQRVTVSAFRMMTTEVTIGTYQAFKAATGRPLGNQDFASRAELPIGSVNWADAIAFCQWAKGRLPTEAEWEYAARAGTTTKYWWGDNWDATRENIGSNAPSPVGLAAHRNPFGLYDMLGNVMEWTSTLFRPYPYSATDGRENADDPGMRILRGAPFTFRQTTGAFMLDAAAWRPRREVTTGGGVRCVQ